MYLLPNNVWGVGNQVLKEIGEADAMQLHCAQWFCIAIIASLQCNVADKECLIEEAGAELWGEKAPSASQNRPKLMLICPGKTG